MAEQMLPMSQVVDSVSPMAAEASAPMLPTIDASMYCMMVVVSCARMAGVLRSSISRSWSAVVMGLCWRMRCKSSSLLDFIGLSVGENERMDFFLHASPQNYGKSS